MRRKPVKSTGSSTASRALKKRSIPVLQKQLDTIFSIFIRLRDSNEQGLIKCCTCPKLGEFKSMHAGHYISRRHLSIRWDERNVHGQCPKCNLFDQGSGPAYSRFMIAKYGPEILDIMEFKRNNTCHMSAFEYEILIREYEGKVAAFNRAAP